MTRTPDLQSEYGENPRSIRPIAQRAISRAAGAPLVGGNSVRLLIDAQANYDAWLAAIDGAKQAIYFENYIIATDTIGHRFRDALAAKAREGVKVRVLQDWMGSMCTGRRFWGPLLNEGGIVRVHNPPQFDSPLGWLSRDHRKSMVIDGHTAFVSGLCVSDRWLGEPEKNIEPWRDTGVEIRGPAVTDLVAAFSQVWSENGSKLRSNELADLATPEPVGNVDVRVIATAPNLAGVYRLDLLVASLAQKRLWLSDAYFAGMPAYIQALRAAAKDGVDVRLLVPGGSDLPWLRPLTTAGYRPLLEAGVRVFEWNGSMMHAKTAVTDTRWARVGSTNLNIASWMSNYELDVAIENEPFAKKMEEAYEADLARSTELVLRSRKRFRVPGEHAKRGKPGGGSVARATAGALRLGRTMGAAMMNRRVFAPDEARTIAWVALVPLTLAVLAVFFPHFFAWPIAFLFLWFAATLLLKALRLRKAGRKSR